MLAALALWLPQPLTLAITFRDAHLPNFLLSSLYYYSLPHSAYSASLSFISIYNQQLKHISGQSLPFDLPQYLDNMRVLSFIAAVAATAPLAVSAAGTLGYALGARHSGKDVLKFQHEVVKADCSSRWVL